MLVKRGAMVLMEDGRTVRCNNNDGDKRKATKKG